MPRLPHIGSVFENLSRQTVVVHAEGVSADSRWILTSARPGRIAARYLRTETFSRRQLFHERENRRNLRSRVWAAYVYLVLSTQGDWSHRILRLVIAQLKFWIFPVRRSGSRA